MAVNYNVSITFKGNDKASGVIGRIGSALGKMGSIAGGILGANIFLGIGQQISRLGRDTLDAVSMIEQLGFTMESLIAREISRGQMVSTTSKQYTTALFQEQQSYKNLQVEMTNARIKLSELKQGYRDVQAAGDNTIGTQRTWTEALAEQEAYIERVKSQMAGLTLWNNRYTDSVTGEALMGTMDIAQAYELAGGRAKELIGWVQKLAIFSPFNMEDVANTLRMAMAYGFTEEKAKRLTEATVNYTAATGQAGQVSERISRALGQVQAKGRLMGEEIRQLTDASIPVVQILAEAFGKTEEEVTKMVRQGLVPADVAVQAIIESMEEFGPAAERQFETWAGLRNAMGDIKELGLQRLFGGILSIFKPFVAEWVRWMSEFGLDKLEAFGATMAQKILDFFYMLNNVWTALTTNNPATVFSAFGEEAPIIKAAIAARIAYFEFRTELDLLIESLAPVKEYLDEIAITIGSLVVINQVSKYATVLSLALQNVVPFLQAVVALLGGPWAILAALAIGALYYAWTNNFGGIQDILTTFWTETLVPFVEGIIPWFEETIPGALESLRTIWEGIWTALTTAFDNFWLLIGPTVGFLVSLFQDYFLPAMQAVSLFIGTVFTVVWEYLVNLFNTALLPALDILAQFWELVLMPIIEVFWEFIQGSVIPLVITLADLFKGLLRAAIITVMTWLAILKLKFEFLTDAISVVWDWIKEHILPIFAELWQYVADNVGPIFAWIGETILPAVTGSLDAISSAAATLIGWLKQVIEWLEKIDVPGDLKQHSPSALEQSLMDVTAALVTLNNTPFLPNMRDMTLSSAIGDIGKVGIGVNHAIQGVENQLGLVQPDSESSQTSHTTVINISTSLGQEELVALLENLQLQEGNF